MSKRVFRELTTPFLRDKLLDLKLRFGEESGQFQALSRQYARTEQEDIGTSEANLRHYEADVDIGSPSHPIPGIERLYRRTLVIEPTLACAAHCRYCIRANYPRHNLSEPELTEIARYCGSPSQRDDLREVLITGGDVLLVPDRVDYLLRALIEHAPNIRIARVATRIPTQDPRRIDDRVLNIFRNKPSLRLELATQINHAVEFCPEVADAFRKITAEGVRVYAQNVLLRGVNDNLESLIDLYDVLREWGIESHYLFHCVPLQGMAHLRTSLDEAVVLARGLGSSGRISGRAKPLVAAMTDIGKIVLYDGVIVARRAGRILLRSECTLAQRRQWNPNWRTPDTAECDADGKLMVWYLDGGAHLPETEDFPADKSLAERNSLALPVFQAS